jgi:Ricin-type beta-trefoil lectin domain
MRKLFAGAPVALILTVFGCSGASPGGEPVETKAESWVLYYPPGFLLFGGAAHMCLAVSGTVQAGATLVSETCDDGLKTQGWQLSNAGDGDWIQIASQANPGLCIDVSSGAVQLAPCLGVNSWNYFYQSFDSVGRAIEAITLEGGGNVCLGVKGGNTASGQPIDLEPCNGSLQQTIALWGAPLNFESEALINTPSNQCLYNSGFAQILGTGQCGEAPAAFSFTTSNQVTQFIPFGVASNGAQYGETECLTVYGFNGTTSLLAFEPCVLPVPATQSWTLGAGGQTLVSGSKVTVAAGRYYLSVDTCVQDDGSLDECSESSTQQWFIDPVL